MANPVWQRMLSGRRLDLLDPSPIDVEIEDIAHGLSRLARWNGQTSGDIPFSVAQHSVLVLQILQTHFPDVRTDGKLYALLHDSAEYVMGDLIAPLKKATGMDYHQVETQILQAIFLRFSLKPVMAPAIGKKIKFCDLLSARLEAVQLAGFTPEEAEKIWGRGSEKCQHWQIKPLPAETAKGQFMAMFAELISDFSPS